MFSARRGATPATAHSSSSSRPGQHERGRGEGKGSKYVNMVDIVEGSGAHVGHLLLPEHPVLLRRRGGPRAHSGGQLSRASCMPVVHGSSLIVGQLVEMGYSVHFNPIDAHIKNGAQQKLRLLRRRGIFLLPVCFPQAAAHHTEKNICFAPSVQRCFPSMRTTTRWASRATVQAEEVPTEIPPPLGLERKEECGGALPQSHRCGCPWWSRVQRAR